MIFQRHTLRQISSIRRASSSRFTPDNLRTFLPTFPFHWDATLGEVYQGMWANYKHRMVYPVLLWAGVCYHYLWNPYTHQNELEKIRARERKLKSLEFHQD